MDIREKIIEGANNLFKENGIRQVTMDSIALSLGISKRTIYENFKDKDDLLLNCLNESMIAHKKHAIKIMNSSRNVIEALFRFGDYNNKALKSVNPCFFNDLKKYHPAIFEKAISNGESRNHELTYMLLKRGVNEGIFIKDINLELSSEFIHYILDFFNKIDETKYTPKQVWTTIHLPYLKGICTEKGRELITLFMNDAQKNLITN